MRQVNCCIAAIAVTATPEPAYLHDATRCFENAFRIVRRKEVQWLKQLQHWFEVRRTCQILESLSDRQLADIGIRRTGILARARGLDPADPDAGRSVFARLAAGLARPFADYLRELANQRRIRRELSAYRDDELTEIGIRRVDIPAIARGDDAYA